MCVCINANISKQSNNNKRELDDEARLFVSSF